MKINENTYYCEWCDKEFKKTINKVSGSGKKGIAVDQCVCPYCTRYVSQKTRSLK